VPSVTVVSVYLLLCHTDYEAPTDDCDTTGSGIAPFFPIPTQPAGYALPFHVLLFAVRIFFLIPVTAAYFLLLSWLPIGSLGRKAVLWCMLGIPGIWWIDLGVDGVKKGWVFSCP
jgi:hypothetical protein